MEWIALYQQLDGGSDQDMDGATRLRPRIGKSDLLRRKERGEIGAMRWVRPMLRGRGRGSHF